MRKTLWHFYPIYRRLPSSKCVLIRLFAFVRETSDILLQVEFNQLSLAETVRLLETVDVFIGLHGGAFDNVPFLPRGAYVIEIMPKGSTHEPLYANRAMTTGKFFIRCV
jgi:capsular polysaccharide biosynthesis protein